MKLKELTSCKICRRNIGKGGIDSRCGVCQVCAFPKKKKK